jgi:Domain of unknown function (DUF4386)
MNQRDPFSPTLQRVAAASGLFFVLLLILSIVFQGGEAPDYDAPAAEFVEYASDNRDDIQLSSVILCLATFEFLWFVGYLRGQLGRAEEAARGFTRLSHIVFAGGVVGAVGFVMSSVMTAAAVSQPEGTSPDVVRSLYLLSYYPFLVASVGLATMLYTAAFLSLRLGPLPKWLGVVGIIGGLAYLLTVFSQLNPEDDGGAFGILYPIGFLALLIFVIGASVSFLREIGRDEPPAAPAAPTPGAAG